MTISIKPTASGSTIEQDGSTVLSVESDRSVDIDSGTLHVDATNNRVGIGTSSPDFKIEVVGGTNNGIHIKDAESATVYGGLFTSGTPSLYLVARSNHPLNFGTNDTERMRIDTSGRVLINSTTTTSGLSAQLFVKGNGSSGQYGIGIGYGTSALEWRVMYMNSGDGTLYFHNGNNYATLSSAGAWTNASDERLKNNIVDIKYGLDAVLNTQPRSYKMNDVEGDFIGFVAQELQTVIPEVVSGDPEKQLGVDYGSLVAVAFKAIQEQQDIIKALETRIQALESN